MDKLIIGNWKMSLTVKESVSLVSQLKKKLKDAKNVEVAVCPPFTSLKPVADILNSAPKSNIALGAQNMHFEESGAFTGEISPLMLREICCKYVIIGHSERRIYFYEDDDLLSRKLRAAVKNNLIPIFCIGENSEEREKNLQNKVVERQLINALKNVKINKNNMVIAYEPLWAIGTGKNATPEQAEEMHLFIRKVLKEKFNANVKILYGGSVNENNAKSLLKQKNIDGALVGGASLKAEGFLRIIGSR